MATRAPRARAMVQRNGIPDCTMQYYKALMDPFIASIRSPCIPDLFEIPSQKESTRVRTLVGCGTAGFGYAIVYPRVWTSDTTKAVVSTTAYTLTNTSITAGVGKTLLNDLQIPYNSSATRSARTVGCGVRIRYVGTNLNQGGRMIMSRLGYLSSPDGLSTSEILAKTSAVSLIVTRQWQELNYIPNNSTECDYSEAINAVTSPLIIAIESASGNQFELEIVTHNEYTATFSLGVERPVVSPTASHSDILGMSAIRNFITSLTESTPVRAAYQAGLIYLQKVYGQSRNRVNYPPIEYNVY